MKLNEITSVPVGDTEKLQLDRVKNDGFEIQYFKNPSEAVQLAAVYQAPFVIGSIANPSEAVQLMAVSRQGEVIGELENPSEAVQLAAVTQSGFNIKYIADPSPAVQQAAVDKNGWEVMQYVEHRSPVVIKNTLTHFEFIEDERLFQFAVNMLLKGNGVLIKKWLRYGEAMREHK
jgi:hypothetical protein